MTAVRAAAVPARTPGESVRRSPAPKPAQPRRRPSANSARSASAARVAGTQQRRKAPQSRPASGSRAKAPTARPAARSATRLAKPRGSQVRLSVHPKKFVSIRAFTTMSVVTFFAVLLLSVMIQSQRIAGQSRLDRISDQMALENARSLDLRAAVAERESPERIMSKARGLGMIDPGPVAPLSSGDAGAEAPSSQDSVAGQGTAADGAPADNSVAMGAESGGIRP